MNPTRNSWRRPLASAAALGVIGAGVGAVVVGAVSGSWAIPLGLIAAAFAVVALAALRSVSPGLRRLHPRWMIALGFDVFATGMLGSAWAMLGTTTWTAAALSGLGVVAGGLGWAFRGQVTTAFLAPRSSPLGMALLLLPPAAAIGLIARRGIQPEPVVPAVVVAATALYLLLYAQAALVWIRPPAGWQLPSGRARRPAGAARSRRG